jgi:hypothetical protein
MARLDEQLDDRNIFEISNIRDANFNNRCHGRQRTQGAVRLALISYCTMADATTS